MKDFVLLHIAKKLKLAGVPQVSMFYYNRSGERFFSENIFLASKDFHELWTACFVGDELFPYIEKFLKKNKGYEYRIIKIGNNLRGGFCKNFMSLKSLEHAVEAETISNLYAKQVLKISKEVL